MPSPCSAIARRLRLASLILSLMFTSGGSGLLARAQTSRPSNSAARPRVVELQIGDEIEPIMAEYVDGGIAKAASSTPA